MATDELFCHPSVTVLLLYQVTIGVVTEPVALDAYETLDVVPDVDAVTTYVPLYAVGTTPEIVISVPTGMR
jgi:hypothetical protein